MVGYAVLDSQYFGVPQRRRRVFLVGGPSERRVEQVLFECQGGGGDSAKGEEARPELAKDITASLRVVGGTPRGFNLDAEQGLTVTQALTNLGSGGADDNEAQANHLVTHSLRAEGFDASEDGTGRVTPLCLTPWDAQTKRVHSQSGVAATLATSDGKGGQRTQYVDAMGVRRLTPTECERLQGFPEIEKSVIIELCSDRRKIDVDAEQLNRKLLLRAGHAGKTESTANARSVEFNSLPRHLSDSAHAQTDVHIFFGLEAVEIRSRGKLLLRASLVGHQSTSLLPIGIEDFARLSAGLHSTADQITLNGAAGLRLSERCLIAQGNGDTHVSLYGSAIRGLAKNAVNGSLSPAQDMRSIISSRFNIGNTELEFLTSFCSVLAAISGFIPSETLLANSLKIEVTVRRGWTCVCDAIPCICPDGPRYKTLGNAVTVPVLEYLGKMILEASR